jgi:hypothetical protein
MVPPQLSFATDGSSPPCATATPPPGQSPSCAHASATNSNRLHHPDLRLEPMMLAPPMIAATTLDSSPPRAHFSASVSLRAYLPPPRADLCPHHCLIPKRITSQLNPTCRQFKAPGLQKGELLNLFLALPLRLLQLSLGINHCVRQAPGVLLGRISILVCLRKLALEKGSPLSEVLFLPMSRGQRCSTLRLHSRHPVMDLPLT